MVSGKALDGERRYSQLLDMMGHYNADFDDEKYLVYGCNCVYAGGPSLGPPVDALDTVCKKYKDCLKCTEKEHGSTCIGAFHEVTF